MTRPRLYPAVSLHWDVRPDEDEIDRVLAAVDDHAPTAVDEHGSGIRVFFTTTEDRDRALPHVATAAPHARAEALLVSDEAWAERSQAALQPIHVGRITVAPPWTLEGEVTPELQARLADPEVIVIAIQPSMGFGTGHHQSTRLCLHLLQSEVARLAGRDVLDVGTGSGVLAIAATRLGAGHATAIDYDPDAVQSAGENLDRNGARGVIDLRVSDIGADGTAFTERFAVTLANLTGGVLVRFADALVGSLAADGVLIASGFEGHEVDDVSAAFAAAGGQVEQVLEEQTWRAVRVSRVPTSSPSGTTTP